MNKTCPLPRRLRAAIYLYKHDLAFRGKISLYQGMTTNLLYAAFRLLTGIIYVSSWFISMLVYYFVLGGLRAYLVICYNRKDKLGTGFESRCYRRTAWMLFILNIPMGIMITMMIVTNSGFSYPGYVIYLSAIYTFYSMISSVVNIIRFRRLGSPVLSAAKALNFVSAMMSVLGLQTAMIAAFSPGREAWRRMMNSITGGIVYVGVIATAMYMLIRSRIKKDGEKS